MRIEDPIKLVSSQFVGLTGSYHLEYRASRMASQVDQLHKQFKAGTPIVVDGKHLVIRDAQFTVSADSPTEITIRAEAVTFESVLAAASGRTAPAASAAAPTDSAPKVPMARPGRKLVLS
jgi:hypothetical protein